MSKHKCNNHKVKENGQTHLKGWKALYCFDCEREFIGRYEWKEGERVLVEKGPDITSIF